MRRRKVRWVLAGLVLLLLAVGAFALWPRPDRITEENLDRVQKGMSEEDVLAILGPPGDYSTRPVSGPSDTLPDYWNSMGEFFPGMKYRVWKADGRWMVVEFDPVRVKDKQFVPCDMVEQSFLDNLLWRAERLWRRWFPEK